MRASRYNLIVVSLMISISSFASPTDVEKKDAKMKASQNSDPASASSGKTTSQSAGAPMSKKKPAAEATSAELPDLVVKASLATAADAAKAVSDPPGSEMTPRGIDVRGVYMPVGKISTLTPGEMLRELKDMGANGVVLDVKDDMGRVTFTNHLPYARGYPHGFLRKLKKVVHTLQDHGIYVIARVVCFKDNWFATRYGSLAIQDIKTQGKWRDLHNQKWVDPHSQQMRDHIVSVAKGAEELGFDEIQLDYVRFPVEPTARNARFPMKKAGTQRYEAIAELLRQVDAAISRPLSIDVFGLTAYHPEESELLGQRLEFLAPHLDAISPMVYLANWPAKYWENPKPERTHQVIKGACRKIRERLGDAIVVRPLLQGFRWRAENWGYSFVVNQIEAAVGGGSRGYLFWNARGQYRLVKQVWADMDKAAAEKAQIETLAKETDEEASEKVNDETDSSAKLTPESSRPKIKRNSVREQMEASLI
ncbi:MAG: hypothetical protein JXR76_06030 [Deltaproteobacteria bacterium]|nr:hypothetical protein [Deltaproteobacteria bacterium]